MKPATTANKQAMATKHHPNYANKSAQHLVLPATFVVNQTTLGPPARVKMSPSTEAESAIFDALYNVTSEDHALHVISLDHHLYKNMNDRHDTTGIPATAIYLAQSIHPDDYVALGYNPVTTAPKSIDLHTMADTGRQSCLASLSIIHRFGLSVADLIPVTTHMHPVNRSGSRILGAVIPHLTGKTAPAHNLETRQIVYVTNDSDCLFLSWETRKDLEIISPQ